MFEKEAAGYLSLICAVVGYATYLWSLYHKQTRPHAFSWIVWSLILAIVYAAQREGGAGPGAWAAGMSMIGCLIVASLSLTRGEKEITRGDWATFVAALLIIPIWHLTADPLWAIILASAIDALAAYPTWRKSRRRPHEESWFIYASDTVKWVPAILAIKTYTATALIYPVCASAINFIIGTTIVYGRWRVKVSSRNG